MRGKRIEKHSVAPRVHIQTFTRRTASSGLRKTQVSNYKFCLLTRYEHMTQKEQQTHKFVTPTIRNDIGYLIDPARSILTEIIDQVGGE